MITQISLSTHTHTHAQVVPRSLKKERLYVMVGGTMRFLGGMNAAMMILSAIVLYATFDGFGRENRPFSDPRERKLLFLVFSVGHFSQFIFNVPAFLMRDEGYRYLFRRILPKRFQRFTNRPIWPHPDQTILLIFIFDGLFFLLNLHCAELLPSIVPFFLFSLSFFAFVYGVLYLLLYVFIDVFTE